MIDALDTWEDITELGYHLINIDIEHTYGKMLLYSMVLKCFDSILTIVAALSVNTDPCNLISKKKEASFSFNNFF